MSKQLPIVALACSLLLVGIAAAAGVPGKAGTTRKPAPAAGKPGSKVAYETEVLPLLKARCYACHGNGTRLGSFEIDSREGILAGGKTHPVVLPGKSAVSYLIKLVSGQAPGKVMPPKGARLTAKEIDLLKRWIDEGLSFGKVQSAAAWKPLLAPRRPDLPPADPAAGLTNPIDRFVAAYFRANRIQAARGLETRRLHGQNPPPGGKRLAQWPEVDDRTYARRVFLDVVGLLPTREELQAFLADPAPDKRARLARRLLDDNRNYAEHWISFWNDMLRNDYTGTGYIDGGRTSITGWLYNALYTNKPYDRFVRELVNPAPEAAGFIKGIVWRGVVNASQRPEVQAAQSVSQVFLGVNLKCASCHDSFINNWKLADAYGMAGIFAEGQLETYRCDRPTGQYAPLKFLYPDLGAIDAASPRARRLEQLAEIITSPKDGRLARTLVNRIWGRLMGRGLVEPADDMDQRPWDPDLLDWLADRFAKGSGVREQGSREGSGFRVQGSEASAPAGTHYALRTAPPWDVKRLIELIVTSRAYQLPPEGLPSESVKEFRFTGPVVKRLSAEQFTDAVSQLTGVWSRPAEQFRFTKQGQLIVPKRAVQKFETPVMRAGSQEADVDLAGAEMLSLVVSDGGNGGNSDWADWAEPRLVMADGKEVRLTDLKWHSAASGYGKVQVNLNILEKPLRLTDRPVPYGLGTHANSVITYLLPKGAVRFRAIAGPDAGAYEQSPNAQTSIRFFVVTGDRSIVDARASMAVSDPLTRALGRPNREQVVTERSTAATTLQALELTNGQTLASVLSAGGRKWAVQAGTPAATVERLYESALGRLPTPQERTAALELLGPKVMPEGVEDLLWALVMLPEFQLIY